MAHVSARPVPARPVVVASHLPTLPALYRSGAVDIPSCDGTGRLTDNDGRAFKPSHALNSRVAVYHGDITRLQVDAVVNAANRSLLGGGGVDAAIHRAAGPALLDDCRALGGCDTGDAKITKGHNLPARYVVHTVGPVYYAYAHAHADGPDEAEALLRSCYERSLSLAAANACRSVALSAVSTGVYGFPSAAAARIAATAVRAFLESAEGADMDRVVFVTFEEKDALAYQSILGYVFPDAEGGDTEGAEQAAEAGPAGQT